MILEKLIIINYKSCQCLEIELEANYPNVFIGINDSGKSTILEAVGFVFDEKQKFNFIREDKVKNDLSNNSITNERFTELFEKNNIPLFEFNQNTCYIVAKLMYEENDINEENESNLSSHLLWVLDKPDNNYLWLAKTFNITEQTQKTFLLTPKGIDDSREYYLEKATALNKVIKEKEIPKEKIENSNNSGRFKTIELIRTIMNELDLSDSWAEYKYDKNFFPQYRYLDWNISMEQLTQFTKETMELKIVEELNSARTFANDKRKEAQTKLNNELDQITESISKDLSNIEKIKANIYFDVEAKLTDFVLNKKNCDGDIHIESQGEGVKRQIWFSLIKWNAFQSLKEGQSNKRFIWCFDEPETHLYPSAQREFYKIISETSDANVQTLLSTHSTIFVDKTKLISINKVDLSNGYSIISSCENVDDVYESLRLKNSDFLFYDKFLVIEGDTEEVLIPHCFKIYKGRSLEEENICLVNLGGKDKVEQNATILEKILSGFKKVNETVVYIFDNDAKDYLTQKKKDDYNPYFVGKQDIEDSISVNIWKTIIDDKFEQDLRLSLEEINTILTEIPDDEKIQSNQKFYPKLKDKIKSKLRELGRDDIHIVNDNLPSKGTDSGELLIKYIDKVEDIDNNIIEGFKKLTVSG